ncbi:MAG: DUF4430 domain-containing protein [Saccharofermentans sp.]|nr:DUF4430 domain-containing protein [Saccharofermentans sp.]
MKNKKKLLLLLIPVVLIAALVAGYFLLKPKTAKGSKNIEIRVVDNAGETKVYDVNTDAEYLRQAMEEAKGLTFSGDESDYGLMVVEINGVTADYNVDQSYWAFYVNDEYCNYGVDSQPVADGDVFRIEYTK